MRLADEIDRARADVSCPVPRVLAALPSRDADALRARLPDTAAVVLATALGRVGHVTPTEALTLHARGECGCR